MNAPSAISTSANPDPGVAPVMLDIAGVALTDDDRRRLLHPLTGGLILFARNFQSREQLTALCAEVHRLRADLIIAVDHEGGRVQRFKTDGFTHLPPMRALGRLWGGAAEAAMVTDSGAGRQALPVSDAQLRALDVASAVGFVLAAELRACGVDLSFAPVLDLDHGTSSVIGDRSLGRDPRVVSLLAKSLALGMQQAGMAHCGKHFPGHGLAVADTHEAIATDERPLEAILADDAAPYAWQSASLSAVMPAHVIYPQVDSRPAGFSARWLQTVLREQLGFAGAVFSDDLSMAAARVIDGQSVSHTEAALAALEAGCDLVLLCNQSTQGGAEAVGALLEGLGEARRSGRWHPRAASEARRRALLPGAAACSWAQLQADARYRRARQLLAEITP